MEINTLKNLVHKILDVPTMEDGIGNILNPKLIVQGNEGVLYTLEDIYLRGDDKVVLKISEDK